MSRFSTLSDDYYVNVSLNTEMDLPQNRETVLHFFERIQRQFPSMRNFYCRERSECVLEEDKDQGTYRWVTIEPRRVSSGHVNPQSLEEAFQQHRLVLEQLPYSLSISPLDCESLNVMYGFDFTYRGNHNELLVEALGVPPAFERLADRPGTSIISYDPSLQIALNEDCRYQCRLNFETRTNAYHVRTAEYPEEQFSVYLTARRYGSLDPGETYVSACEHLARICQEVLDECVIEQVLRPLQQAITIR